MNIVDFLLERITEDESVARAAASVTLWRDDAGRVWMEAPDGRVDIDASRMGPYEIAFSRNIVRHLPNRVLAGCGARRRMIEIIVGDWPPATIERHFRERRRSQVLTDEDTGETEVIPEWAPARLLRLLALPYADHPDYESEWE